MPNKFKMCSKKLLSKEKTHVFQICKSKPHWFLNDDVSEREGRKTCLLRTFRKNRRFSTWISPTSNGKPPLTKKPFFHLECLHLGRPAANFCIPKQFKYLWPSQHLNRNSTSLIVATTTLSRGWNPISPPCFDDVKKNLNEPSASQGIEMKNEHHS